MYLKMLHIDLVKIWGEVGWENRDITQRLKEGERTYQLSVVGSESSTVGHTRSCYEDIPNDIDDLLLKQADTFFPAYLLIAQSGSQLPSSGQPSLRQCHGVNFEEKRKDTKKKDRL